MFMFYENKYIYNAQGGLGAIPPEAEEIFKNQTKWRLFLYFINFFFCFWQGSLNPQNYELAPQLS